MSIGLAMVMFDDHPKLSSSKLTRYFLDTWDDEKITDLRDEGEIASFRVADADVIVALMPAPIPWADLEGPCATSLLWPDATSVVKKHKTHTLITVNGDLSPIELSILLTKATAAVLGTTKSSIGAYWGNSTSIIRRDIFMDFSAEISDDFLPIPIWVDTRIGRSEGRSCRGFTTGLKALGHLEMETLQSPESIGDLRDRFNSLVEYLLDNGKVINDGDTIGQDEDERIRVIFAESSFGQEGEVMRLVYESTK